MLSNAGETMSEVSTPRGTTGRVNEDIEDAPNERCLTEARRVREVLRGAGLLESA